MKTFTTIELEKNINEILEEVLRTGNPIEINKEGKRLLISPVEKKSNLQNLIYRPEIIKGNPDDLVAIKYEIYFIAR
jgi:hypothetical protein